MKGYENVELCSKCGGICCKGMPAPTMPEDFNNGDLETIVEALKTGKWAIDYLNLARLNEPTEKTENKAYFIRPKVKGRNLLIDTAENGECIFLTFNGCELPFEKRPNGCRMLEPKERPAYCTQHGATVQRAAIAWLPFKKVIERAIATIDTNTNN